MTSPALPFIECEPMKESGRIRKRLCLRQELKKKHGIDYDNHASYRFVEN